MHSKNKFKDGYNFDLLIKIFPELYQYVIVGKSGRKTIDFSNSKAVKAFNTALLFSYNAIHFWEFPDKNLCPPIPGRLDYIHVLFDLIKSKSKPTIVDIGTGATCIYPLLGIAEYDWNFIVSESNKESLLNSKKIIKKNGFTDKVKFIHQNEPSKILDNVLEAKCKIDAVMCNPPFYSSHQEAKNANSRKTKNLKIEQGRNFSGSSEELYYKGGEKAFLHNYLYESSVLRNKNCWYTSLVSNKENVKSLKKSFLKLNVRHHKVIPLIQGNKKTRIVAWHF